MKNKKLFIFSAITIILIIVAGIASRMHAPQVKREKELLLPELALRINDIAEITIKGNKRNVDLKKQNESWVIGNADNYPAVFEKVKDTVISLSALKIVAEKTDNPELYSELEVEGPDNPDSRSLLLTLKDATGQTISSIIIGAQKHSKATGVKPGLYVRRPQEKQALLVEGSFYITDQVTDWLNQNIIDIPSSAIQEVRITHPDGDQLIMNKDAREDPEFNLQGDIKQEKSVFKIILNRISTALEEVRADGVVSADTFEFSDNATITVFKTFEGIIVTVKSEIIDEKPYAHISVTYDSTITTEQSADIENEAQILNSVLSDWVYQIPDFKYEDLTKKLENITTGGAAGGEEKNVQPGNSLDGLNFSQ